MEITLGAEVGGRSLGLLFRRDRPAVQRLPTLLLIGQRLLARDDRRLARCATFRANSAAAGLRPGDAAIRVHFATSALARSSFSERLRRLGCGHVFIPRYPALIDAKLQPGVNGRGFLMRRAGPLSPSVDPRSDDGQSRARAPAGRRAGHIHVYKDHGISGAKGRAKRPAFDARRPPRV
jgi:hypothetical protein